MLTHFFKSRVAHPATLKLALIFCLSLAAAACGGGPSQTAESKTPEGQRAPRSAYPMPPVTANAGAAGQYGWTLLDGRRQKMSDYAGRVVVLDFWATYCPPCREEIPHLIDLQRRYGPQGLNIIGLNVGGADDRPEVPGFVRTYRIQYMLAYPDADLVNLYLGNNDVIPQTIVFDRRGRLVKHFVGYDKTLPAELEKIVKDSLAAPAE